VSAEWKLKGGGMWGMVYLRDGSREY
jgi:hypothetical protein